jgi:hypothetical protein
VRTPARTMDCSEIRPTRMTREPRVGDNMAHHLVD